MWEIKYEDRKKGGAATVSKITCPDYSTRDGFVTALKEKHVSIPKSRVITITKI